MVRNAFQGLLLVFLVLSLFLRPSLAIWVAIGLPISFMGAFATMGLVGASINLVSLFAFIVVLGILWTMQLWWVNPYTRLAQKVKNLYRHPSWEPTW